MSIKIPAPANLLITSPFTMQLFVFIDNPLVLEPALVPSSWINRTDFEAEAPACEKPSITTVSVITGNGDSGRIVNGPEPGMLNLIVSFTPTVESAYSRAYRKLPIPLSAIFVTIVGFG